MTGRMESSTRADLRLILLALSVIVIAAGCGEVSPGDEGEISSTEAKAGLPGPPVPVGPFLDGVLPVSTPNDASAATWEIVEAFPGVSFNQTLVIVTNPEPGNDRLYVGSRDGNIFSIENDPLTTVAEPFMDIRDRVAVVWDGGFLGLAFHPEFGQAGSLWETTFYVYYSSYCPTTFDGVEYVNDVSNCNPGYPQSSTGGFFNTWLRLSRFNAYWDASAGTWKGDPTTEKPMFNIRLYNGSHRGGGPVFGRVNGGAWDGHMYVAIGDQFRYETAQDITSNFEGGSIRIEVDIVDNGDGTWTCPPGTHYPNRVMQDVTGNADEMTGQQYCIPDDNPWQSPSGAAFEEFNTIGHRNPHRIAVDPLTGRMWSGEIGQSTREEINVIVTGRNYQWPYREGLTTGVRPKPTTVIGIEQPPVIDFVRSEARAIIGGYVYRGSQFPSLYGKYLAADYVMDTVWAITLDETTMTATKDELTTFWPGGLGTWGQDKDGEVYLGDVFGNDALYTLNQIGGASPEPPQFLSQTGAFDDTGNLQLADYWVPYDLNVPFWSDNSEKFRWIALPNDGTRDTAAEQVAYSETGDWDYPIGTVLMKHFELVLDENDPADRTRLETRLLVHGEDERWYGVTYRWLPNQLDAELLPSFDTADYTISLAGGGTRDQTWYFPSRDECLSCHLEVSAGALGLNTRQQNGVMLYPSTGLTDNQLVTWNSLDMFSPPIDETTLPTALTATHFDDVTASLQDRARSWLDSNCGYCHRPGGANAGFDARLTTPFENQGFVYGGVRDDLGQPGMTLLTPGDPNLSAIYQRAAAVGPIAMPPLAKSLAQDRAVEILGEWISRVSPSFGQNGIAYEYYEPGALSALPDFGLLVPEDTGTVSTFDIGVRLQDDNFAFRFTSTLGITTPGDYTFYTTSDDGSQLFIGGALVVDNDGLHGAQERSGVVNLTAGFHAIEVTMFERSGGQSLVVNWQGPDTSGVKGQIPVGVLFLQQPSNDNDPPTLTDPGAQTDNQGQSTSLSLSALDPNGDALYFDAAGLPDGLVLNHQTGQISGVPTTAGVSNVTASASDASEVSVANFTWTIGTVSGPACGDGSLDAGEECDDGNLVDGDGCTSGCVVEYCGDDVINNVGTEDCEPPNTALCNDSCRFRIPLCGDGFLTPPEQCEDGNVVDGDGCSSVCTTEVFGTCGDGTIDVGEDCDDGNLLDGDGCASDCSYEGGADLTQVGTIIARILTPIGGGNPDPEVIRDGDKPPVGYWEAERQYDTYSGGLMAGEDWIGYAYATELLFGQVVFQEGIYFGDGGYFETLTLQVRQNGTWADVPGLTITPTYVGADAVSFDIYVLDFTPMVGDAIRIHGVPGGTAYFISIGELEVFAATEPPPCGNSAPDPGEECDDGNLLNGDGCNATCQFEMCGDGLVNNGGAEDCEPPGTEICTELCKDRVPLCGDGFVTPPEECEDGNTADGDGCSSTCTIEIPPGCGDGNLDAGEQCDDGNLVSLDGCASDCVLEVCGDGVVNNAGAEDCEPPDTATCTNTCTTRAPLCGDGFLTPPEACEDGNTADGDGCSATCQIEIPAGCGNGNLDAGESCDDGNLLDGDGCASDCSYESGADLTQVGTIVARITTPLGGGNPNPEVIRDGDKPPVGYWDGARQYDTYSGGALATEDWIGYEYPIEFLFGQVEFQEGIDFGDGGYFDALTVQVRRNGIWGDVPGLTITPTYVGADGVSFDTYVLDFDPTLGDAIRIHGPPGGTAYFISVGELEVFASTAPLLCGNGAIDAGEQCDDGNLIRGDGCDASCQVEFCGDDIVNNGEACDPPDTATCTSICTTRAPLCGDGFLTPPEQCEDGNTADGDGCSSACQIEIPTGCGNGIIDAGEACDDGNLVDGDGCASDCSYESGADLTQAGTIIARIMTPLGGGNPNPEVIRDGDKPPVGYWESSQQYDTYSGGAVATEDWIGYEYATDLQFAQVVFQEGIDFGDGGYFDDYVTVQVRQNGTWVEVPGLTITPTYAVNDGVSFDTYTFDFTPVVGDAIRIYGPPGGTAYFISVGELEVFAAP